MFFGLLNSDPDPQFICTNLDPVKGSAFKAKKTSRKREKKFSVGVFKFIDEMEFEGSP
jgi:hypothetical protein